MTGFAPKLQREQHNRNLATPLQDAQNTNVVQSKLEIGKPDDKYEKEADAMADKVMMKGSGKKKMIMMAGNPDNPTIRKTVYLPGHDPNPDNPLLRTKLMPKKKTVMMAPYDRSNMVMMAGNPTNPTIRKTTYLQKNQMAGYKDEEKVQMQTEKAKEKVQRQGGAIKEALTQGKEKLKEALKEEGLLGGEVTNDSDISWLISGASNSDPKHFMYLPPSANSDSLPEVKKSLTGDVDAVWPAGITIKYMEGKETKEVNDGVFKIEDHRNANIEGTFEEGYMISDFYVYVPKAEISTSEFTQGWKLPDKY